MERRAVGSLGGGAVVWLVAMLVGCAPASSPSPPAPAAIPSGNFLNRVWQVAPGSSVAPGASYVFVSDGTLLVTSPGNRPSLGEWAYQDGRFTMIEEGIRYPTDVLPSGPDTLRLVSHNPGEPVTLVLVAAPAIAPADARR